MYIILMQHMIALWKKNYLIVHKDFIIWIMYCLKKPTKKICRQKFQNPSLWTSMMLNKMLLIESLVLGYNISDSWKNQRIMELELLKEQEPNIIYIILMLTSIIFLKKILIKVLVELIISMIWWLPQVYLVNQIALTSMKLKMLLRKIGNLGKHSDSIKFNESIEKYFNPNLLISIKLKKMLLIESLILI